MTIWLARHPLKKWSIFILFGGLSSFWKKYVKLHFAKKKWSKRPFQPLAVTRAIYRYQISQYLPNFTLFNKAFISLKPLFQKSLSFNKASLCPIGQFPNSWDVMFLFLLFLFCLLLVSFCWGVPLSFPSKKRCASIS